MYRLQDEIFHIQCNSIKCAYNIFDMNERKVFKHASPSQFDSILED